MLFSENVDRYAKVIEDKTSLIFSVYGYLWQSYYILPGTSVYSRAAFASSTLDLDLSMTVNNNDDFFFYSDLLNNVEKAHLNDRCVCALTRRI